ncbi:hypothetical protein BH09MYX1_BH09MYX1_63490 [soil metagenome]
MNGALDMTALHDSLARARNFAELCCSGDETGVATGKVTVGPIGYDTQIDIEPDDLARGATGSCLHGSFHRVTTRAFRGEALTVPVTVRVKP